VKVEAASPEAIVRAAALIREGGVVAFPTETVYGLGADATNPVAVARVFELKRRPSFDPLIVHVPDPASAGSYGVVSGKRARDLIRRFWPGPLTSVVPPIVTAGLETVALRMPAHPVALQLIRAAGRAVAAPSANPFGCVSPTDARHVARLLPEADLILDGGRCPVGVESTIVDLSSTTPRVLRPGGIPVEQISEIVGPTEVSNRIPDRPEAPGQLARHYATQTRLEIIEEQDPRARPGLGERVGLLCLRPPREPERYEAVEVLSAGGNLREAAANLFAALHRLDTLRLDRIVASPFPEHDLGLAIMDRLRRCSTPDAL
jgi:L-threonylcarbamoyladenylate synthase